MIPNRFPNERGFLKGPLGDIVNRRAMSAASPAKADIVQRRLHFR
jgi:hypothetical protein